MSGLKLGYSILAKHSLAQVNRYSKKPSRCRLLSAWTTKLGGGVGRAQSDCATSLVLIRLGCRALVVIRLVTRWVVVISLRRLLQPIVIPNRTARPVRAVVTVQVTNR